MREGLLMPITITHLTPTLWVAECSTCLAGITTTNPRAQKWADKHDGKDCK